MTRNPLLFLLAWHLQLAAGCVSIQAFEPVVDPPVAFRSDVEVAVEFVPAGLVGLRCAERGAKFLGLPALNAGACADTGLVSIVDPCMTFTAGAYAEDLCVAYSTYAHLRMISEGSLANEAIIEPPHRELISFEPPAPASISHRGGKQELRIQFVAPDVLRKACAVTDGPQPKPPEPNFCIAREHIIFVNPCRSANPGWYERTLCHELAHVNGWPASHAAQPFPSTYALARESPEAIAWAEQASRP